MTYRKIPMIFAALLVVVGTGCTKKPDIPFATSGGPYQNKPDFAEVQHSFPLSADHLMALTPSNLEKLTQEEVDQVYARLPAGPIPDGAFEGTFFFSDGGGIKRLSEVFGGIKGLAVRLKLQKIELLGQALWQGKVFYRDDRVLRNMILDRRLLEPFIDDPDSIPTVDVNGKQAQLLFPAKLYCGQSLLDSRRESIIIDYAFSDEIDGYREIPDFLASRRGLKIRDEIRMIRPGFYLGRAYLGRTFLLNFTLYNETAADAGEQTFLAGGQVNSDCWSSEAFSLAATNR